MNIVRVKISCLCASSIELRTASLTIVWHVRELLLWLRDTSDLSRRLAIAWSKLHLD
jgi:hypothetical protein